MGSVSKGRAQTSTERTREVFTEEARLDIGLTERMWTLLWPRRLACPGESSFSDFAAVPFHKSASPWL